MQQPGEESPAVEGQRACCSAADGRPENPDGFQGGGPPMIKAQLALLLKEKQNVAGETAPPPRMIRELQREKDTPVCREKGGN